MPRSLIIAITGATGFLGPYVVKEIISRGFTPRLLVRTPDKAAALSRLGAQIIQGDLSAIPPALTKDAGAVLHMAGLIKAPSEAAFFDVNEGGTARLAARAQADNVPRFVYLSSQAASQPQLSGYAASKRAGEAALSDHYNGEAVIIRAPAVFGPGDDATAPFFSCMKKGILPVPGGKGWRSRKLSLIYAPDLARVLTDQITVETASAAPFTPAGIPSLTWTDFAQQASGVMGRKIKAVPLPLPLLKLVAGLNSGLFRRLINPHLTLGKLSEFLYEDWSAAAAIDSPTPFDIALRETMDAINARPE
jgi:uncharacterized protein YbjT (DUF2867 family)